MTINDIGIVDDPDIDVSDEDSSSGDEDDERFKNLDCFYDEEELKLMQLDNITIQRSYYYVICTNTT